METELTVIRGAAPRREPQKGSGDTELACPVTLQRFENGSLVFKEGMVAVESDLNVVVDGVDTAVLTRTPGDDLALITGYLFTNAMISEAGDIAATAFSYRAVSRAQVELDTSGSLRRIYPSPRPVRLAPARVLELKRHFEHRQSLYKNTRSTHAAALFDEAGELIAYGEDVGRHNGFDKAIGHALLEGTLDRVVIAMLSSRLALELVTKANTANIPILCGFSAATSSAINFAERNTITLIGRVRKGTFDVYANGWRLR